jgi:hypothetical protein
MPSPAEARAGYLTIDAVTALAVTTIAVSASVGLAVHVVARVADARDRLAAARLAETIYEELYAGERPDGRVRGEEGGRAWAYDIQTRRTADGGTGSSARSGRITVARRKRDDLVVEAVLPPAPATP